MTELPAFLKREPVTLNERDRLSCERIFTPQELAYIPAAVLVLKVAQHAANLMRAAGAIEPYVYSCRSWKGWYLLTCEEV